MAITDTVRTIHAPAPAGGRPRRRGFLAARLVVLAPVLAAATAAQAFSLQEGILIAKPAVALVTARVEAQVTLDCGRGPVTVAAVPFVETGSGWFVDGRGYLITNAHVVDPVHRSLPWVSHELKKAGLEQACVEPELRRQGLMRGQDLDREERIRRQASERALASARVKPLPQLTVLLSNGTTLEARVEKFSAPLYSDTRGRPLADSGRDLALLRVKEGTYPVLALSDRDPKLGDTVHILGFPAVVQSHELLNRTATLEASVTTGTVSGLKQDAIGQDLVQTDAPAAPGNSGGPAIASDSTVIGVLTFVSPSPQGDAIVQGFNFLIPAGDVRKFLGGTGVVAGRDSGFNRMWRGGLTALFGEKYALAAARLAEADALLPNLPDVRRALAEAEHKVRNPPPRPFPWMWLALGVIGGGAAGLGVVLGRRWWKNRHRVLPNEVIRLMEAGKNPALVDVRTREDYETSPLKLPGAVRLAPEDVDADLIDLTEDRAETLVLYDTTPDEATSARVAQALRRRGWKDVRLLKGGLGGWTNARLPIEAKSALPSIGLELYKHLTLGDLEKRHFARGALVWEEGDDPRGEAFIVHSGTVEVCRRENGAVRVLATLGVGQLVGEMALFRKGKRTADVVAASEVDLLVIKQERLEWLIRNRPEVTLEMLRHLSDALDAASR